MDSHDPSSACNSFNGWHGVVNGGDPQDIPSSCAGNGLNSPDGDIALAGLSNHNYDTQTEASYPTEFEELQHVRPGFGSNNTIRPIFYLHDSDQQAYNFNMLEMGVANTDEISSPSFIPATNGISEHLQVRNDAEAAHFPMQVPLEQATAEVSEPAARYFDEPTSTEVDAAEMDSNEWFARTVENQSDRNPSTGGSLESLEMLKPKRTVISPSAKQVLENQLSAHPYPEPDTKEIISASIGVSVKSISTWFTNARSRRTVSTCNTSADQAHHGPLPLPSMDRTKGESSSFQNLSTSDYGMTDRTSLTRSTSSLGLVVVPSEQQDKSPTRSTPSATGIDRLMSSTNSIVSCSSFKSKDVRGPRSGRRCWQAEICMKPENGNPVIIQMKHSNSDEPRSALESCKKRLFCTWPDCDQMFQYPSEWSRHEEAVHYYPYQWECCLTKLNALASPGPSESQLICRLCGKDVTPQHMEALDKCMQNPPGKRTFYRRDQFKQHFSRHCKSRPCGISDDLLDEWKTINLMRPSDLYCGFCETTFTDWAARRSHVLNHLRSNDNTGLGYKSNWRHFKDDQSYKQEE